MNANDPSPTDERLARFWRRKPLLLIGFSIAVLLTTFFGARTIVYYADWKGHDRQGITKAQPWMRPTYIARASDVERSVIYDAIGVQPDADIHRLSLSQIARKRGVPVSDLLEAVDAAIAERRTEADQDG